MFRNYRELIASYREFYNDQIYSDQSNFRIPSPDSFVGAPKLPNEDFIETACSSINETSTRAVGVEATKCSQSSLGCPIRGELDVAEPINSALNISSTGLHDNEHEQVLGSFNPLSLEDLFYVTTLFISFIIVKRNLSKGIGTSSFVDKLGLRAKDRERLEECIWRLVFYAFSSFWLIYSCFMKRHGQLYLDHNHIIAEYSFTVDPDEYLICMIEVSFYLHATYAILFEDVWRRDSPMMLLHHFAAIFSVVGIYTTRLGLTVMVLRDTCDVLLEVTKLAMCLRIQHGKVVKSLERSVKFFLAIFAAAFVINQLYYYPLFCLYHALTVIKMYQLKSPIITGIVTCSLIFLVLDLFWFLLIVRLLYRIVFTRAPLKDLREYEYEDEEECKRHCPISSRNKTD